MAKEFVEEYHNKVKTELDAILNLVPPSGTRTLNVADRGNIRASATAMSMIAATLVGMLASMQIAAEEASKKLTEAKVEAELLRRKLEERPTSTPHSSRTSYAAAVRRNEILISSSVEGTSSDDIKKALKEKVDPVQGGVGVAKLVKLPNNTVKLACETTQELAWMKKAIEDKTDFQVRAKACRNPCVKLFGIPRGQTVGEMCRTLFAQNEFVRQIFKTAEECAAAVTERRKFYSLKDEWNHTVVLEVPGRLFQAMKQFPVRYGFESFWAQEFLEPRRCFNCQQFGHVARDCKGKEVCRKCGVEGHKQRACKAAAPRCAVCVLQNETQGEKKPTDHWVASSRCEVGRRLQERLRGSIDYGK